MSTESDSVEATLQITGLPDGACFKSFDDLLRALPTFLQVLIPKNITNVIVSNIQPIDTQRDSVWFRMSNGGVFMGIYTFSEGSWKQVFPIPEAVYRIAGGDSRNPPPGYISVEDSGSIPQVQIDHLMASWMLDPTGSFYVIYDVVPAPT